MLRCVGRTLGPLRRGHYLRCSEWVRLPKAACGNIGQWTATGLVGRFPASRILSWLLISEQENERKGAIPFGKPDACIEWKAVGLKPPVSLARPRLETPKARDKGRGIDRLGFREKLTRWRPMARHNPAEPSDDADID